MFMDESGKLVNVPSVEMLQKEIIKNIRNSKQLLP